MNATIHHYVVLRLAPDTKRGEIINVGLVLFSNSAQARVIVSASLNKLRAIDSSWNQARLKAWTWNIEKILNSQSGISAQIRALEMFGFCEKDAIGMFCADGHEELSTAVRDIKEKYVANRHQGGEKSKQERRTRLQKALRDSFKQANVLGASAADLSDHLVVPNVPVPGYDGLKSDFLFKNGVYRLTQTLDCNVLPESLHSKLSEASLKSMAAQLAAHEYGDGTMRFAVVDIPKDMELATKSHVDLLHHSGFDIYHFGDSEGMKKYMAKSTHNYASPRI